MCLCYNTHVQSKKERAMFDKILKVLSKNLGYTVILVMAIVLFAVFSDGLIAGLITAASALLAYVCASALYQEYKKETGKKTATAKKKTKK